MSQFSRNRPALQIQSDLWDRFNFKAGGQWMYTSVPADLQKQDPDYGRQTCHFICPVCQQVARIPVPIKTLDLSMIGAKLATRQEVVLCYQIYRLKDKEHLAEQVHTYWAGQCEKCLTIYWGLTF